MITQRCACLQNQIVNGGSTRACKGSGDLESILGVWPQRQCVGKVSECHQAFELVIAVSAAAEHPQRQINFGRSPLEQRHAHAKTNRLCISSQPPSPLFLPALACDEVSSGRPDLSFSSIFGRSSG